MRGVWAVVRLRRRAPRLGAGGVLRGCTRRWWLAALGAALTMPFAWCAPASAISQRGHVFSFSFGSKGKREGEFKEPMGIAVNDTTHDLYVADHKNKRVVQLAPVLEGGELTSEHWVRSFKVPAPSQVAVDNSSEGSDPSRGDVYVVGSSGKGVYKFSAEGVAIGKPIKQYEVGEHGVKSKAKLGGIEGIAVDAAGTLYVYEQDGEIFVFSDGAANKGLYSVYTGLHGEPGLALDSEGNFFLGAKGEAGFPVAATLEGITGKLLCDGLDDQDTTALAVNTLDVPANGVDEENDAYVANVTESFGAKQTTIAQFAPGTGCGKLVQEFGRAGLSDAQGVAVDDQTGTVFVTDAVSDDLDAFALEKAGAPAVEGLSVSSATPPADDARRISAQVDPEGSDTHSSFEYGPESCTTPSACTTSTATDVGGGFGSQEVSLELNDLVPGTYRYRVIAENGFGSLESPERTFTILEVPSGLPDGRAWEMVSPPNVHGAAIEALSREGGLTLATEDGDALTYITNGVPTEQAQGNRSFEPQQVLATRGARGWSSQDIATPQTTPLGVNSGAPEYQFFSTNLSLALVEPFKGEPALAPGEAGRMVYLRDDQPLEPEASDRGTYEEAEANSDYLAPGFLPVVSKANAREAAFPVEASFRGATPDLESIVFDSDAALTGASSGPGLYEWTDGKLRFVSELPNGRPASASALGYYHVQAHAISSDGVRVIWTNTQEEPGHLYMRDTGIGTTVELDAVAGISEEDQPQGAAVFQTASSDGSRVFFTDDRALTTDSSSEPREEDADLYECEMSEENGKLACDLRDLTLPARAGEHAAVQGLVLGASEDGSRVYLVAHGVLASNETSDGESAEPGKNNLYELHYDGTRWTTTFIAVLSGEDSPEWEGNTIADTAFLTARVSPNGEFLAFMSQRRLTGYDNEDVSSRRPGERLDEEVYLYDSKTSSMTCVSCDPTGARPVGVLDEKDSGEGIGLVADRRGVWSAEGHEHWLAGNIPGWTANSLVNALFQSRYLSNEGRLFFDSADALVPGITDPTRAEEVAGEMQRVGVENVYEFEPSGVGGCKDASGGCVALLSGGASEDESAFLEATPSGNDVFFLTAAPLSHQGSDDAFEIYDARVCTTSSPCLTAPERSGLCDSAEECRSSALPGQARIEPSGSATFSSAATDLHPASPAKEEVKGAKAQAKPETRVQRLASALKACHKRYPRSKRKRRACETRAHKLYGPRKKAGRK